MGSPIRLEIEKPDRMAVNTSVDKDVFEEFKKKLKYNGYPINTMLQIFMKQVTDGTFELNDSYIKKLSVKKASVLNTPVNKDVYVEFKKYLNEHGLFLNAVLTAFMKEYTDGKFDLEYVNKE